MINLLQLRYFYVVAQERSFTRASQKLRVAQPSLSKMVRQLEEHFGHPLLARTTRDVSLTGYGQRAFEYCRAIFESAAELERSMADHEIIQHSPVKIGTSDLLARFVVARALARSRHPLKGVYPVIETAPSLEICHAVARRRLNFAVLFYVPELPAGLVSRKIARIRFRLVAARKYSNRPETLDSFIGSREVENEGAARFPTLGRWREIRPEARIRFSSNCVHAHLELVAAGLGISILPEFLVAQELRTKRLVDLLPREKFSFPIQLIYRSDFAPKEEVTPVLGAINDAARELASEVIG